MLYLAEVQKQKPGLLSSGKTDLKLLACQKTDQSWNSVSEEVINAEEGNKLTDGALVLVEVNPQRQVQRIQEAGRPLVNILQTFSRQLEKFKVKEEEIDQWKESLTFQAQELNRRELELEIRLEQLEQMEEDFQRLEAEKQELSTSREEIENLRGEIERNRQELAGAWDHLRGEQRRLEETQPELQAPVGLDKEQSRVLRELLDRLSNSQLPCETVRDYLKEAFEIVETQQVSLNAHCQQLEEQKKSFEQQQSEVARMKEEFFQRQNSWQEAQNFLEQQILQLKTDSITLESKQAYILLFKQQLESQQELHNQIRSLVGIPPEDILNETVDIAALENMPLEELQKLVLEMQEKFNIDFSFVNDQEHELKYKEETIEEIKNKLAQPLEFDREQLEEELVDELDVYEMLNKTLVGQRRSLIEQEDLLKQHQRVLQRRQGINYGNNQQENTIDLTPIILELEKQQQEKKQQLQDLENEIEQIRANIEVSQSMIENQTQDQQKIQQELKELEEEVLCLQTIVAESKGRVDLYQEALQPVQDNLHGLHQKLFGISEGIAKVQETGDYQLQTVTDMRQVLLSLIQFVQDEVGLGLQY